MDTPLHRIFNRARLDDRVVNELLGLAHGVIADGIVSQQEAEYLKKWLVANIAARDNPLVANLLQRISGILSDNVLDREEAQELLETLSSFAGGDFELGELLKSSCLPLDNPQPTLCISGSHFCFTGTFAFGSRKQCEQAVAKLGGYSGSMTMRTDYLVVGIYATESWAHSSYGRKIEKALTMKEKGVNITIIGENHWLLFVNNPSF